MNTSSMMRVGVLASGQGTNLQALIDASRSGAPYDVVIVVSNVANAPALERARRAGIAAYVVDHRGRSREAFDREVAGHLREAAVDIVCLAGFMRILSPWFVGQFRGRILNMHPSLLPRYGGRGMLGLRVHETVLSAGDSETGCTIHLVDEHLDGGPILAQVRVPVFPGDTAEALAQRVHAAEHRLYPEVVRRIAEGRVSAVRWRERVTGAVQEG